MARPVVQKMSTPRRFFVSGIDYPAVDTVSLEGEEYIHARSVLRVREGEEITLLDGSGKEFRAIISKIEKKSLLAHIVGVSEGEREPAQKIYLICGALKGDKTELIIQKATELGVYKIGVFSSEYSSAYMNAQKLERLEKVSREAAKQCLRSRAPKVEYFENLESALKSADGYKNKFFACEFAEKSDKELLPLDGSTAVVVGSEGGFSREEFDLAKNIGFSGLTLGKRILRAETAAIAVCTLAAYGLGELK